MLLSLHIKTVNYHTSLTSPNADLGFKRTRTFCSSLIFHDISFCSVFWFQVFEEEEEEEDEAVLQV